ncbi:MAG: heavy-metal-associated domain-containing protein [Betaproteobacteria bacterium]|nr:heavy-metal-associated domain-containing protein [Betaproteobacteria bacterium]
MRMERVNVSGMTCEGCVGAVTHALGAVAGVSAVNVSFETGEATVQFDERRTSTRELVLALSGAGYDVRPVPAGNAQPAVSPT